MRDGFAALERMRAAAGHIPEVQDHLRDIDRWLQDGTARPLQTRLGFPSTPAGRRRYSRDRWIGEAARQLQGGRRCEQLAAAWSTFVTRGPWQQCSDRTREPAGLPDKLSESLWWATHYNAGRALSATQLFAILKRKPRTTPPIVVAPKQGAPMNELDRSWVARKARAAWDTDPQLRAEFSDDRDAYVAYAIAEEKGLARIFNDGPTVRGVEVERQRQILKDATEHSRLNAQARGAR